MQFVLDSSLKTRLAHGGEPSVGVRKRERPIATKRPMHVVMRAKAARGHLSFLRKTNATHFRRLLRKNCAKGKVTLYESANSGNYLHLLVKARSREGFQNFLRELVGQLAMAVTGAR